MLLAADEIVPPHVAGLELEAPMGSLSRRLQFLAVGVGELQRGAVVDRRAPTGELALPLQLELVLRLVGRITPSARFQLLDGCIIDRETVRLLHLAVPAEPEPGQVFANAVRKLFGRTLAIGVVETQEKASSPLLR